MKQLAALAFIVLVFISIHSCNENRKARNYNQKTLVDETALTFIKKGIEGGKTEVEFSKLALKNSQNKDVIEFANMMITDHTSAGKELESIAADQYASTPDNLSPEHAEALAALAQKTGAAFDRDYAQAMVQDHEQTIALFKSVTENKNKKINDFADKMIPKLTEHLKHANALCAKLK